MREIKFRAWDSNEKQMLYSETEQFDDMLGFRFKLFHIDTDKPVYMQFTGLYDKNGKEIYEGDIVHDRQGRIMSIEYSRKCAQFQFRIVNYNPDTPWHNFRNSQMRDWFSGEPEVEIIGNIYENPELLEKQP